MPSRKLSWNSPVKNLGYFKTFKPIFRKCSIMKKINEIKALVSLLDDPDLNIYNQVKNQLLELGEVCIPILEKANFENHLDSVYKTRIQL